MRTFRSYLRPGQLIASLVIACLLFPDGLSARTQSRNVKVLVGGTLIDGLGSKPIRNSVIIIEGQRIKAVGQVGRSEEHTSELQSQSNLVCRLLLEKKKTINRKH